MLKHKRVDIVVMLIYEVEDEIMLALDVDNKRENENLVSPQTLHFLYIIIVAP